MSSDERARRADIIKGLRDLVAWLEANPDVPVGPFNTVTVQYSVSAYAPWRANFPGACIEVERVAKLINRTAKSEGEPGEGRRSTVRRFGPVEYKAIAIEKHTPRSGGA